MAEMQPEHHASISTACSSRRCDRNQLTLFEQNVATDHAHAGQLANEGWCSSQHVNTNTESSATQMFACQWPAAADPSFRRLSQQPKLPLSAAQATSDSTSYL